ncbi:unnamed protein product [Kluyveromyces dobzhanskii CBS 2104]|uniref:WGS project CCBQ000000000 data, contig 00107 n=1 Tax=Kluyveromyces dobzhanskii CBS 2104 TaxID=1427455 RepID=A0A0A8L154_9SACH|nr:unnamed protein product [Kluyveromyces dobzhanskii CBS 2104]
MFPVLKRFFSDGKTIGKTWFDELKAENVPSKLFIATYDRSRGKGGQNVNKVNSKCTLTLHNFSACTWFPEEIRRQLLNKGCRYYARNKDALVIQSDETRSRDQNREICVEKLVKEVKKLVFFPGEVDDITKQKWTNIKKKANEVRLNEKKHKSEKKKSRSIKMQY